MVERVLLVNAGNATGTASIPNDGCFPALGVVSLATVLQQDHPDLEIEVMDGQVTPQDAIELKIRSWKPSVVGFSVLSTSYLPAIQLAHAAKAIDAIVVFGNDQAAMRARQILTHQEVVDYVSTADIGEFAFSATIDYLRGRRPLGSVQQLVYRAHDGIAHNDLPEVDVSLTGGSRGRHILDLIPVPNRRFLAPDIWSEYLRRFLTVYGEQPRFGAVTGVTTINRARGCARAKRPCTFCGIQNLVPRFSSPPVFWRDVEAAHEEVNASFIYEVFDSMTSAPLWIEQLVAAKPTHLDAIGFFVYAQALETTPRIVELFQRLGVTRVNMGLESGDDRTLRRLKGPRDSVEQNKRACQLYKNAGIGVYASLIIGAAGETHETIENTIRFAEWLVTNEMVEAIEGNPLYPDFAAGTGDWLLHPEVAHQAAQAMDFTIRDEDLLSKMSSKYSEVDLPDFEEVSRDWTRIFCHVSWEEILAAGAAIRDVAARHGTPQGAGGR